MYVNRPLMECERRLAERWMLDAVKIAHKICRRYQFGPEFVIEDMAHEGVMYAAQTWKPGRGASFGTWLYTCVWAAVTRHNRGRFRQADRFAFSMVDLDAPTEGGDLLGDVLAVDTADGPGGGAIDAAGAGALREIAERVIDRVDRDDVRAALRLRYFHGCEVEAAARMVGIPRTTLTFRIAQSRDAIRAEMAEAGLVAR